MTYVSSSRRLRPQRFAEVLDQPVIVRILQNAIAQNRIANAYVFSGIRGTGKTTLARLLAKALNCDDLQDQLKSGQPPEPCNKCASCVDITAGKDMNVLEIDASSNRGIDQAKEITRIAQLQSAPGKWSVIILDEAHGLTKEAQNALLALFEQPPSSFLPILCTTELDKILPTILSRCSRLDVKALSMVAIASNVQRIFDEAGVKSTEGAVHAIARLGNGSLRDVQQVADQVVNCLAEGEIADEQFLESVVGIPTSLIYRRIAGVMNVAWVEGPQSWFELCEDLAEQGADFQQLFFQVVSTLLRDFRVCVVSKALAQPVVPYWSGIPHDTFKQRTVFTHDDLDILNQSWDDSVHQFSFSSKLGPRPVFEFFFLRAWDYKRAKG